jgi:acyl-CoA reductase-like NAD-dependent aldehyde dehydrogenase
MSQIGQQQIIIPRDLFFKSGKTRCISFRVQALKKLKKALNDHKQLILEALFRDMKKPSDEAYQSEIKLCVDEIDLHIKKLSQWKRSQSIKTPSIFWPSSSFIVPEPYGVVLIISTWNFPIALSIMPLIGAISAGNCAIIKPSELAPASADALAKIISSIFEPAYVSVIQGNASTAQELLALPFHYIFFTGSTRVGKLVMKAAAEHLIPLTLELGGCNPCIVDKECNIQIAARRIAWAKFYNAGQSCLAPNHVFVHESIKDRFTHILKSIIAECDALNGKKMSSIINQFHFDRLCNLIVHKNTLLGGDVNQKTLYFSPTLLETTFEDPLINEEIFGPILPIVSYSNLNALMARLAFEPKPLACYFFSSNKELQSKIIDTIQAGSICINDAVVQYANLHLPFGGIGTSGFGSYHGKKSFDTFSHYKSVMKRSFWFDWKWRYE